MEHFMEQLTGILILLLMGISTVGIVFVAIKDVTERK